MRFAVILISMMFSIQCALSQKLLKNFSTDVCDCLNKDKEAFKTIELEAAISKCMLGLINNYEQQLRKKFGEEFYNNDTLWNFGIEVGKWLVVNCPSFYEIATAQHNRKQEASDEYFTKAEQQSTEGLFEEAILNYNKAIQSDPNNAGYYNSRGVAYNKKGDNYNAISDFIKATELNPNYGLAYYNMAYTKYQMNDFSGALPDISKSINCDDSRCESYNLRGLIDIAMESADSSIYYFKKAFNCDTANPVYSFNVGYSYYFKKEYSTALNWFIKSYLLDSTDHQLVSYIGNCYNATGEFKKAIDIHTIPIRDGDSTDYVCFYNRGYSYYNNGDYFLALTDFLKSYELDSSDNDIIFYLAKTYEALNQNTEAEKFFNKAILNDPDNAAYYDNRAAFYDTNKKYDLAIHDYSVSLSLYPDDCKIHLAIGKLYLKENEKTKSAEYFKKSFALGCPEAKSFISE